MINELMIVWAFRIGIIFLLLGLLLPSRFRKKIILIKALHKRPVVFHADKNKTSKIVQYLDNMTENTILRPFMLKENSDEYSRLESLIVQAGGLNGLTPNIVQLFRILLPTVSFVVMLLIYIVRVKITHSVNLNATQTQLILEKANVWGFCREVLRQGHRMLISALWPYFGFLLAHCLCIWYQNY